MKFEIEAELGVISGLPSLDFIHPSGAYSLHLENHNMQPGTENPSLIAYVTFEEGDFNPARSDPGTDRGSFIPIAKVGDEYITAFLYFLSFATGMGFRVKHPLCLFDWTPGIARRHGIIYRNFADPNFPALVLNQKLFASIERLTRSDTHDDLMQALRWFTGAVSAKSPDVQFEMFWFSIETLGRYLRNPAKVPDRCPHCREPLYCPKCDATPVHRPYPSQAIQVLFGQYVNDAPDLAYRCTSAMRHALLHGDRIERVEQEFGFSLNRLVEVVGAVAWAALFGALREGTRDALRPGEERTLDLLQPTTFLHFRVATTVRMSFLSPLDRAAEFRDLPGINIELFVREGGEPAPN